MKTKTKLIIGTQIGLLIVDIISVTLLKYDVKFVVGNHLAMTVGYFLLYFQLKWSKPKQKFCKCESPTERTVTEDFKHQICDSCGRVVN